MKVYDAMASAFVKEGTTTLFGLLGDGQMTWWSAIAKYPQVKIVDARDEGCAVTMAEGYAMATGEVGVASATQGPGLARMTTALIVAARSRTPVVVYTSRTALNNEHIVQYLDQDRLVSATGAGYIEVLKPSYAEDAVRDAFYRARRESRPIVLCAPLEVQQMECDFDAGDYRPSSAMFPGQQAIRPDLERLREAASIVKAARKPVIVLGRGAMSPAAKDAANRLADRIGALIATTLVAKGTLADCEYYVGVSGLFSTREVLQLFEQADCVIAVGARLSTHTLAGGYLYSQAKFIQIDIEPHKVMGNDRGADCYLQGDAAATLEELIEALARDGAGGRGFRTAEVRRIIAGAGRDPAEYEIDEGTVDPREAIALLDEKLPPEVHLVSSGNAHACSFRVMLMQRRRGLQIFCTAFGCIGQALSTAVGAAVGVGGTFVCVEGDGSALQNIQELDTVSRLGLKFLYVVVNDEAYGAEYHKLRAHQRDPMLSVVRSPDFAGLGRDFGCRGESARTLDDFGAAIDRFLAGDAPMVIDLRISRNVLSIPYRRLHFGMDV
ncbi:MAG: thiamine pyrophosphate-binding protein [Burkholderiales bacterium]|nr:thiamine pyrophosphate-binding protein [Burkholderiales bacterium]